MLAKTKKSFSDAFNGLRTVAKEERNFKIQLFASLSVLICIFVYDFVLLEIIILTFCVLLVLTAEIVNTAVEDLCNKIQPNQDPVIGKIKDIMAAYVLLTSIGALIIGLLVFYHHFLIY